MERNAKNLTKDKQAYYEALADALVMVVPTRADYSNDINLGVSTLEGEVLTVKGVVEVSGSALRLFIYEGPFLRHTMRIKLEGQRWMATNTRMQIEVRKSGGATSWETIGNKLRFVTPQEWLQYLYTSMYNTMKPVRNWQAFSGHEVTA